VITLQDVISAQQTLRQAEEADRQARESLRAVAYAYATTCAEDPDHRMDALNFLYWQVPEMSVDDLESAFELRPRSCWRIVARGPVMGTCVDCGVGLRPANRTEATELLRPTSYSPYAVYRNSLRLWPCCKECHAARDSERGIIG
jgi:hypothetical protein